MKKWKNFQLNIFPLGQKRGTTPLLSLQFQEILDTFKYHFCKVLNMEILGIKEKGTLLNAWL